MDLRTQNVLSSLQSAAGTISLPAGAYVTAIVIGNTTANAVTGGLKFGTTVGGTDIVAAQAVAANSLGFVTDATLLKRIFSAIAPQTIYIDAVGAWNSAVVNIQIIFTVLPV